MGCFIAIKRIVFEDIGTYNVSVVILEKIALGIRTKEVGYKIGGVQMDKSLTALWSERSSHVAEWYSENNSASTS